MKGYEVRLSRDAANYLRRLDRTTRERILERLREIGEDPYGEKTKRLVNGEGRPSSRVGGWRIVLWVDEENRCIEVSYIGPRGEVYRRI